MHAPSIESQICDRGQLFDHFAAFREVRRPEPLLNVFFVLILGIHRFRFAYVILQAHRSGLVIAALPFRIAAFATCSKFDRPTLRAGYNAPA